MDQEKKSHVEHIAEESLAKFGEVAEAARIALGRKEGEAASTLAVYNAFTDVSVAKNLDRIRLANRESFETLAREPAIARIKVLDENNEQQVYFICRTTPISGVHGLASYRAPVGRLASLAVGEEFTLPNGTTVEVLEQAQLHPRFANEEWDSKDSVIRSITFGPITIESLRTLIESVVSAEHGAELLDRMLAEESEAANVVQGLRRSVITKMGLRDQPILDKYQDEIFRLPLDQHLLILGPPGTGKTTTLIRRLGQKLDVDYLTEDEAQRVRRVAASTGRPHSESWLMFTPTDLLKRYLKEAFAREGVPATDNRIRTWADYRRELARNTFNVLKSVSGTGFFVLKENAPIIKTETICDSISWYSDFFDWQRRAFIDDLRVSATKLGQSNASEIANVGTRLSSIIEKTNESSLVATFTALADEVDSIQHLLASLKDQTDGTINRKLNLELNRDKSFITELATFIDGLQQQLEAETDDLDEQELDEDEDISSGTGLATAVNAFRRAVRAQARAHTNKRDLGRNSRNRKIIDWLGSRTLAESENFEVGTSLLVQSNARRFVNPVKRYMDSVPRRYRTFRRQRQPSDQWYHPDGFTARDISPLELDVVVLTILRSANDLTRNNNVMRDIDLSEWSSLKPVVDLYQNQILVDEVTDFSPLQIACMAALSHNQVNSFFACGDFNQRMTAWGSRSMDEIDWAHPGIDVRKLTVIYRQSS